MAQRMSAKAGGLADVSASLVSALFELGADVHVAMPNYRRTHVVLRTEPGGLVHVIYTARTPDPEREVLETVLSTVHAEAAS